MWQTIAEAIASATGSGCTIRQPKPVSGGCIHCAYRIDTLEGEQYFVKLNSASSLPMFETEAAGLQELAAANTVRVPRVICHGQSGCEAYLALEYISLRAASGKAMEQLGEQLAALHRPVQAYFGWQQDNTIGASPQHNTRSEQWPVFWRDQRLGLQLQLAAENGYRGTLQTRGERLLAVLDRLLAGHTPSPSLLHGDLWGGNCGGDEQGRPVIFDPAVYYGDRETDLAMTELFGGFSDRFYAAYRNAWPLNEGYPVRRTLYNLYHVLNHLNLFGAGYLGQAERMLATLLAEASG